MVEAFALPSALMRVIVFGDTDATAASSRTLSLAAARAIRSLARLFDSIG
jgi:hypothetical protein